MLKCQFIYVWVCVAEKEVTGSMLCEFCEEDIKDVFTEFKDRFLIRKLLRDIADKQPSRQKLPASTQVLGMTNAPQILTPKHEQQSDRFSNTSGQGASHSQTHAPSPSTSGIQTSLCSASQLQVSKWENGQPVKPPSKESLMVIELDDENDSDNDSKDIAFYADKRMQQVKHSQPKLLSASVLGNPYMLNASVTGKSLPSHTHCVDRHTSQTVYSAYPRPDHAGSHTTHHANNYVHYAHNSEDRWKPAALSSVGDQALCLIKVQSSIAGMPVQTRSETASPTAQPSSTTPDMTGSEIRVGNFANASVMAMNQMASRHTAYEILSKKEQRSRPNSAQKLGSILIRNAAQHANLWSSPPHLRNISSTQKQLFLDYIYQVAPHLRECEALLWQRLSETLQNRRKYLLDKKLGKRGVSSSSSSEQNSPYATLMASSDSLQDFGWTLSANPDFDSLKEISGNEETVLTEDGIQPQECTEEKRIKIEKD